jgi:hypothetical protein
MTILRLNVKRLGEDTLTVASVKRSKAMRGTPPIAHVILLMFTATLCGLKGKLASALHLTCWSTHAWFVVRTMWTCWILTTCAGENRSISLKLCGEALRGDASGEKFKNARLGAQIVIERKQPDNEEICSGSSAAERHTLNVLVVSSILTRSANLIYEAKSQR